jgi:hypothetical protein
LTTSASVTTDLRAGGDATNVSEPDISKDIDEHKVAAIVAGARAYSARPAADVSETLSQATTPSKALHKALNEVDTVTTTISSSETHATSGEPAGDEPQILEPQGEVEEGGDEVTMGDTETSAHNDPFTKPLYDPFA